MIGCESVTPADFLLPATTVALRESTRRVVCIHVRLSGFRDQVLSALGDGREAGEYARRLYMLGQAVV